MAVETPFGAPTVADQYRVLAPSPAATDSDDRVPPYGVVATGSAHDSGMVRRPAPR